MTQILDLEGGFSFKMRCDRRGGVPAGDLQTVYRSGAIGSKGVKRGGRGGSAFVFWESLVLHYSTRLPSTWKG